jgi:hypothetical protein
MAKGNNVTQSSGRSPRLEGRVDARSAFAGMT